LEWWKDGRIRSEDWIDFTASEQGGDVYETGLSCGPGQIDVKEGVALAVSSLWYELCREDSFGVRRTLLLRKIGPL